MKAGVKAALACTIALSAIGTLRADTARKVEFCELAKRIEDYAGQMVELRSEIRFHYHGAVLVDDQCNNLGVQFPTDNAAHLGIDELLGLRFASMSSEVRVFATFRGIFTDNRKVAKEWFEPQVPPLFLDLQAVTNIKTEPYK
jgi:hypothetical protein